MISVTYAQTMARYNAWQNSQIIEQVRQMDDDALRADRGAFFGSILGTLNHLLWGDLMWLHRFDPAVPGPQVESAQHKEITPDGPGWITARQQTDATITDWAGGLTDDRLAGDLSWFSGLAQRDFTTPMGLCVTHFFNHQTHHRGQVHAMLKAAGVEAPVTDLTFMPEG